MFFKKKKLKSTQLPRKKTGVVDKVIMGTILGGAIGSVVGITLAPKSGKETRKYIKDKGKIAYQKSVEAKQKFMDEHGENIEAFKHEARKKGGKVWNYFKKRMKKRFKR